MTEKNKYIPDDPKSEFDLHAMTTDQLVEVAKQKSSLILHENPFRDLMIKHLVEVLGVSESKALFENMCGMYGLKPEDWNRPFVQGRSTLRITGFVPEKPKNKFKLTDENGKKFHCKASFLQRYLVKKTGKQIPISEYLSDENL